MLVFVELQVIEHDVDVGVVDVLARAKQLSHEGGGKTRFENGFELTLHDDRCESEPWRPPGSQII